jgi:hypothetical protein
VSRKKLSRNAPCPCGSGKKYKKCCYGKDFDFEEDGQGNVFKSVPITEDIAELLKEQRRKFVEKHGRLAEEKRALGDRWYRQEYLCSFEDVVDAVFSYADIQAVLRDDVQPLFMKGKP